MSVLPNQSERTLGDDAATLTIRRLLSFPERSMALTQTALAWGKSALRISAG